MRNRGLLITFLVLVVVNVLVQKFFFRIDLTQDQRYSISEPTKALLRTSAPDKIEVTLYLDGALNAGFLRLQQATTELLDELNVYGKVYYSVVNPNDLPAEAQKQLVAWLATYDYHPTAIYERDKDGKQVQSIVWPYAKVSYKGHQTAVLLLQNNRGFSGAENLNHSIEGLEYVFAEAVHQLAQPQREKVAFLEGHGELSEHYTADIQQVLEPYFDIYRGSLTDETSCIEPFKVLVVADPQEPFSEQDKYILDQYLMRGGRILWLVNGVKFSQTVLANNGFTPLIALDLNLQDLFFRYGVRINPRLVADAQCLSVPVEVSGDPQNPQYQPMPWCYAPLLLTSAASPITRNVMQVSATFASDLDLVGEGERQKREILLATGNSSHLIAAPAEVDLSQIDLDRANFESSYVPVGASLEGEFASLFAHRMVPEGVKDEGVKLSNSFPTKQVFIAAGSVIRNDWQNGQALPVGFDRYSQMQFGNRDLLVNALLWLGDDTGLIALRQKTIPLRMLNAQKVQQQRVLYTVLPFAVSIGLLLLLMGACFGIRKVKFGYFKTK